MTTYLTIITTVLVATQLVRITQNHISLFRQEKEIKKVCGWLKDNDVSEHDFEVQRKVFYLLYDWLTGQLVQRTDAVTEILREIKDTESDEVRDYLFDVTRKAMWNLPSTGDRMLICPECGLDVHSDFDRCPRCGAEVRNNG